MPLIDLVIVAIIAFSTFSAFRAGLIRQVVSLASVVLGGILAARLYPQLAENIDFLIADENMRKLVAFLAIFAGVVLIGTVLASLLRTFAGLLFLGPLDHIGGAVFGLLQGLIFVEFVLFALTAFPPNQTLADALNESRLAPVFLERLPLFERFVPDEIQQAIDSFGEVGAIFPGSLDVVPGTPTP